MKYQREVEKKYVVDWAYGTLAELESWVSPAIKVVRTIHGHSSDLFWKAPNVDFVRLRENTRELTVKVTDKGTVTDRIEENVVVEDIEVAAKLQTLLFGSSCLTITKQYSVFYLALSEGQEAVLSIYTVEEDPETRVFLEVEATNIETVDKVASELILKTSLSLKQEKRSLFQIFSDVLKTERHH
jgi:hypothetical protein